MPRLCVRENDELVVERCIVAYGVVDLPLWFPARAGIGRAREPRRRRAALAAGETLPCRVDEVGIGRIGGDRLLVIERTAALANQRRRPAPDAAAIHRAAPQHRTQRARRKQAAAARHGTL